MFPSQRVEDSLDPDWEFAPDHPESDEGSDLECEVDADTDAPDSEDEEEEEEDTASDLGMSAPHATLRDWSDDGDEEAAGEEEVVPRQPSAGSAAVERRGASGSWATGSSAGQVTAAEQPPCPTAAWLAPRLGGR
jgi:hypothetical protein